MKKLRRGIMAAVLGLAFAVPAIAQQAGANVVTINGVNFVPNLGFVPQSVAGPAIEGVLYYDTNTHAFRYYNGTADTPVGPSTTSALQVSSVNATTYFLAGSVFVGPTQTYYVSSKPPGSTTYNGVTVTTTTVSDAASNPCTVNTSPCATIAGAYAKIGAKSILFGNPIIQLSTNTNTGTDCHLVNALIINNIAIGFANGVAYNFTTLAQGGDGETDQYPPGMITIQGDTTTPSNVTISGETACGNATPGTPNGFYINHTHFRFNGVTFKYFGPTATATGAAVVTNNSLVYMENIKGQSTNAANQATAIVKTRSGSLLKVGGTWTAQDLSALWATNAIIDDETPLGALNLTFTGDSNFTGKAIQIEELAKFYLNTGTYSFLGTGAYCMFCAQDSGFIYFNDGAPVSFTFNAANAKVVLAKFSFVQFPTCAAGFNTTCTNTASSTYATGQFGSSIFLGGTSGKGSAETDNSAQSGSCITRDWFGDTLGRTCGSNNARIWAFDGVRSINQSTRIGANLGGTCTFSASTTATCTLGATEPDTNYTVTVESQSGTGLITVGTKTTTNFVMTAASSNSLTVNYTIVGR